MNRVHLESRSGTNRRSSLTWLRFHVFELTVQIPALELGNLGEDPHFYMENVDKVP
jgi:hypothetical protein